MKSMEYKEVRKALIDHLKTFKGLDFKRFKSPNRPLDGNGAFKVPPTGQWCAWFINYGGSFISGIDSAPCTRRVGRLAFQIFTPKGEGMNGIDVLVESLTTHFQYMTFEHLEVLEGSREFDAVGETHYQTNLYFTFRVN